MVAVCCLLVVFTVSAVLPGAEAQSLAKLRNGCTGDTPLVSGKKVTLLNYGCYRAGKRVAAVVTHSYSQLDYGNSPCNTVATQPGVSFTPVLHDTYYVTVNYAVG